MSLVLILAGDTVSVRSIEMSLQVERFEVRRVSNSEQLIKAFTKERQVGVLMDLSAPWQGLSALIRRLRGHGTGRGYRVLLFGTLPAEVSPAVLQSLGISEEDVFPEPVDMPRMVQRLRSIPAPSGGDAAVTISALGFPIRGSFGDGSLARVLVSIESGGGTGQLELVGGETVACLSFKAGRLVGADCRSGPLALTTLVRSKGLAAQEALTELAARGPVNFETLVAAGLLSPHQVPDLVKEQAMNLVRWGVGTGKGDYRWIEGARPRSGGFPTGLSLLRAVIDAVEAATSHVLPGSLGATVVSVPPALKQRLKQQGLQPLELRAIHLLDGQRSAQAIVDMLGAGDPERARVVAGFIRAVHLLSPPDEEAGQRSVVDWEEKKRELEEVLDKMEGADPFGVLEVTADTPQSEIRARFFALSKQYHPDRYHAAGEEVVRIAQEIFTRVQEAYDIVGDPRKREEYTKKKETEEEGGLNPRALIAAEIAFSKATLFLRNKHYAKAREALEEAVQLNPHEPEYRCHLAWATYLSDPSTYVDAVKTLHGILKEYPNLDKGFYFLGSILKARKELHQAEAAFKRAVAANPDNVEAKRELRLMAMRREKGGGKKGGGKGFLGRFRRS